MDAFGDVAGGEAKPVGDDQASKYNHEQRTPVALQRTSQGFGQNDLFLGLQLATLGLNVLPLELELQLIGLDHVVDDVQDLAANRSDHVPQHDNLRCYGWCSDAWGNVMRYTIIVLALLGVLASPRPAAAVNRNDLCA